MVPLETEPPDGSAADDAGAASGAAAPISVLSRLALRDALLELEATVRKTRDVSSAAVLQLWQVAERRLGVEVDIEDPALRGLFGLHVLAVEELCGRVRAQAETTLAAMDQWSQPPLAAASAGLQLLSGGQEPGGASSAPGQALAADLVEADWAAADARTRASGRIRAEVCDVIDLRLQQHDGVREDVRERQRWGGFAVAARRDVAWLRREAPGSSGLRALSGRSAGPLGDAELRLREASDRVAELDGRLLKNLMELQADSVEAVRRPWAALVQIQAEFFMAQQAIWHPVTDAFEEFANGPADGVPGVRAAGAA